MINVDKVLESASKKYENYVNYIARNPSLSKTLSGEAKAILESIVEAINEELEDGKEIS